MTRLSAIAIEDRFADQDLFQTYNSISGSESSSSDLSDTEDELMKTKTYLRTIRWFSWTSTIVTQNLTWTSVHTQNHGKISNLNCRVFYLKVKCILTFVEYYQALPQHKFCGAPVANYEVHVRVNLDDETQVKDWVDSLSEKTKCTYRASRTYKPSLKRVTFKIDMHCQHFRKPLTKKQQHSHDQKKRKSLTLLSRVNCKITECPSRLNITIQKPPKKKVPKHRDTHKAFVISLFSIIIIQLIQHMSWF